MSRIRVIFYHIPAKSEVTEDNIYTLAEGSLGGKGRGLAFINALINKYDFDQHLTDIKIRTPKTFIIGIREFEEFIANNNLASVVVDEKNYEKITGSFHQCEADKVTRCKTRSPAQNIKKAIGYPVVRFI